MKTLRLSLAIIISALLGITNAWAVDLSDYVIQSISSTAATSLSTGTWYVLYNSTTGKYLYNNGAAWRVAALPSYTAGETSAENLKAYLFHVGTAYASGNNRSQGTLSNGNDYYMTITYGNWTYSLNCTTTSGTIYYDDQSITYAQGGTRWVYCNGSNATSPSLRSSASNTWRWYPVTLGTLGPKHTLTFQFFYDANNNGSCDSGEEKGAAQTKQVTEGTTITSVTLPTMPAAAQLTSPRFGIGTPTWANCIEDHSGTVTADATFHISIPDDMTRVAWNRVASQTSDIANWYNLRGEARKSVGYGGWYAYNDGGTVHFEETAETDVQTDCWGLVGNPYDGFLIVNADAGLENPLTVNSLNVTQTKYKLYLPSWSGTAGALYFINATQGFCFSEDGISTLSHSSSSGTIALENGSWDNGSANFSLAREYDGTWWVEPAAPSFDGDISVKVIYNYWYDEDEDGEVDEGEIKYTQNTKTYPGMDMPACDYKHFGIKYTVPAACSGTVPSGGKTVVIPLEDDMSVVKWTRTAAEKKDVRYWFNMHMNASISGGGAATQAYYVWNDANRVKYNATGSEANTYMWALVGNPYKFKMVNYSATWGYSLKSNATSGDDGSNYATVASGDYYFEAFAPVYTQGAGYIPANQGFCLQPEGTTWYLNLRGTTVMGSWTGNDEGSTMWVDHYVTFKEVGVDDYVIQNYVSNNWASYGDADNAQLKQIATYPDPYKSVWHLTTNEGVTTYFYYRNYGNLPAALSGLTNTELNAQNLDAWKKLNYVTTGQTPFNTTGRECALQHLI